MRILAFLYQRCFGYNSLNFSYAEMNSISISMSHREFSNFFSRTKRFKVIEIFLTGDCLIILFVLFLHLFQLYSIIFGMKLPKLYALFQIQLHHRHYDTSCFVFISFLSILYHWISVNHCSCTLHFQWPVCHDHQISLISHCHYKSHQHLCKFRIFFAQCGSFYILHVIEFSMLSQFT